MNSSLFIQTSSLGYSDYNKNTIEGFTFFTTVDSTTVNGNVQGNVNLDTGTSGSDFDDYTGLISTLSSDRKYDYSSGVFAFDEQNLEIQKKVEEDANQLNNSQNNLAIASGIAAATMIVFAIVLSR
jgi:hypothetical protein